MAKFRLQPELVKLLIPVVLPFVEDLAKRTTSTVDDTLVAALRKALENPVVLAFLLSLLEGGGAFPNVVDDSHDEQVALAANADLLCSLFSVAKVA